MGYCTQNRVQWRNGVASSRTHCFAGVPHHSLPIPLPPARPPLSLVHKRQREAVLAKTKCAQTEHRCKFRHNTASVARLSTGHGTQRVKATQSGVCFGGEGKRPNFRLSKRRKKKKERNNVCTKPNIDFIRTVCIGGSKNGNRERETHT